MGSAQDIAKLEETVASLCQRVEHLLEQRAASSPHKRVLIALAGVPGSGKSTICSAVIRALASRGTEDVAVLPMDGFHYPKAVLSTFDDPDLAFRKRGAPYTFDAAAFLKLIVTLSKTPVTTGTEAEVVTQVPSFNHAKKDPEADDIQISSKSRVVIVEGNYTLLNKAPWDAISRMVEDTWFVDVPMDVVKERLVMRHIAAGIEPNRELASRRKEAGVA